jgi:hypothetical protein
MAFYPSVTRREAAYPWTPPRGYEAPLRDLRSTEKPMDPRASKTIPQAPEAAFDDIDTAGAKLGVDSDALRARCRRAARRVGNAGVAELGGGIVAFKFGSSWRVRFPQHWRNDGLDASDDLRRGR